MVKIKNNEKNLQESISKKNNKYRINKVFYNYESNPAAVYILFNDDELGEISIEEDSVEFDCVRKILGKSEITRKRLLQMRNFNKKVFKKLSGEKMSMLEEALRNPLPEEE